MCIIRIMDEPDADNGGNRLAVSVKSKTLNDSPLIIVYIMNRPTWDNFIAVNEGDKQNAFESLARMLFKSKYNLKDNLAYFKNHAGNETNTITVNGSIVGFQAKYFEGSINKTEIINSMTKAKANNPGQTDYVIYTNSAFGNPKGGKTITDSQKAIEDEAIKLGLNIEWWFGDNILDAAAKDSLVLDLFFNSEIKIREIHSHITQTNEVYFSQIDASLKTSNGDYHFDRDAIDSSLIQNIKAGKSVMLVGESGSGKSAILKNYYEKVKDDDNIAFYIVNAAQLDTNIVNDIFNLHVAYTIVNFTRFYDHCKTKVMVIDSAEKLLLNVHKLAVNLLVNELLDKGWTFIFTCRQNSQAEVDKYLKSKLTISAQSINVPQITKDELYKFAGSYDIALPPNERLLERLTNLFYLARYVELNIIDATRLTLQSFRDEVWNQKVRGGEYGARGQYREDTMLAIIEDQVTNNRYFTPKQGLNHEAAYALVSDDVLSDNGLRGYSAKHDIYAEWAMDYILERKYENANCEIPAFINSVGETLAMVNTFARWFEAKIEESDIAGGSADIDKEKTEFAVQADRLEKLEEETLKKLENTFDFLEGSKQGTMSKEDIGKLDQEMLIFITGLTTGKESSEFLVVNPCERYKSYSALYLKGGRRNQLLRDME